jgi:WD40 repeat protein
MAQVPFLFFLALTIVACQTAPTTLPAIPSTETLPPNEPSVLATTVTRAPTSTLLPTTTVFPEILKEEASPLCEKSFSALFVPGPLNAPFAVMRKMTYADAPAWEFSHQLPHMSNLAADDVQTVFCISESRTQTGTYADGSPAYQLLWDVRAISFPDGRVTGRNSFAGSLPPETKELGAGEELFPYREFAAWVFDKVDHPNFLYFKDAFTTIVLSPDGKIGVFGTSIANQIVEKDYQAKIFLFNLSDLEIISALEGHQGTVTSLAFSPDGKILASSGFDLFVKFWDVGTRRLIGQISIADTPNFLMFSPDGRKLAVASNLEVTLIDPFSMKIEQPIQAAGGDRLAFSPDNSYVYVKSSGTIKIIDLNANIVTLTFPDPFTLVPTVEVAADGSIIGVTYETPEAVDGFVISPDGAQIITYTIDRSLDGATSAKNVRLATWDSKTGKYQSEIKFSGDQIQAMEFSPDGTLLAIGNNDQVWLWDTASWQLKEKLTGHIGFIADLTFTADGTKILSAGSDGTIRAWDLEK